MILVNTHIEIHGIDQCILYYAQLIDSEGPVSVDMARVQSSEWEEKWTGAQAIRLYIPHNIACLKTVALLERNIILQVDVYINPFLDGNVYLFLCL